MADNVSDAAFADALTRARQLAAKIGSGEKRPLEDTFTRRYEEENTMATTIKLYTPDEIRRFSMDLPRTGPVFSVIVQKLRTVCSSLDLTVYNYICWKDSDGDLIIMSCDAEVREALRNFQGGVLRIYVKAKGAKDGNDKQDEAQSAPAAKEGSQNIGKEAKAKQSGPKQESGGHIHKSVVCDGCDKEIGGTRFKCAICPDFDLCSICEEKRIHDEHPMLRLAKPEDLNNLWKDMWLGNAPNMLRKRLVTKHRGCPRRASQPYMCGGPPPPPAGMGCPVRGNARQFPMPPPLQLDAWKDWFGNVVSGFQQMGGGQGQGQENNKPEETPSSGATADAKTAAELQKEEYAKFLQTVGDQIANTLGQYDRPNDGQPENVETETVDKKPVANVEEAMDQMTMEDTTPAEVINNQTEAAENESNKSNDWTMLNHQDAEAAANKGVAVDVASGVATSTDETTSKEVAESSAYPARLYPDAPAAEDMTLHPDPKVNTALERMLAMGFSNDGGWLSQLLENKQGDISAVLDALQPAFKSA